MASVVKRTNPKYWTACFTSRDGRQLKRSTKSTIRSQALEIAIELERVEKKAQAGSLTTIQLRKVLSDVSEKVTGDSLIAQTTEAYLNDWLSNVAARNSAATHERYKNTVKLFLANPTDKKKRPVPGIMPKDIEDFLTWRLKSGVAPKTAIIDVKTLSCAFRRAEAYSIILKNPVAAVRLPKDESSERDIFSGEDVEKLLRAAPTLEWQTLILLGYFLGARLSDCVHMKWENVVPDQGVVIYHQQKTGKKVVVPIHFNLIEHFKYLATFGTAGFLCPKLANKGPGGKHGLSEGFKRIMKNAGVDTMTAKGKGTRNFSKRTFHSLRHSFNSALANAGVAEEVRMKLTGHSSKPMNTRYTHLEIATLKNAVTALPLFGATPEKANTSNSAKLQAGASSAPQGR
jgi:integrase